MSSTQTGFSNQGTGTNGGFDDGESLSTSGSQESKAAQHTEGKLARAIEDQTAKLPSDTFLWAAIGAMGASAIAEFTGHKDKSRFFGQWVAPLLLLGVYNKLVKLQGSDQLH
jgi:hypothetical protein